MKNEIIRRLEAFKGSLQTLKKDVRELKTEQVGRKSIRDSADNIATTWVEQLRSPLEHTFSLPQDIIQATADQMRHLQILSRPNNLKSSYLQVINLVLHQFDDKFILPIKQTASQVDTILDLQKLIPSLPDPLESAYLKEAIDCAGAGFYRAAIVMGWCCVIDRVQKKVMQVGLTQFNDTSLVLKNQSKGRYRTWNKSFSICDLAELQGISDKDLLTVVEGMNWIDQNQSNRLMTCYGYRLDSAHPGNARIDKDLVVLFFKDVNSTVFQNPHFQIGP